MTKPPVIALLGGTFDPIHNGHLLSAQELKAVLAADEFRFIPCHRPPHRATPGVSSQQRLAMVELAIAGKPGLSVDGRELQRDQLSYTIDTLIELRREYGEHAVLCWVMGVDAFCHLDTWHRWQELLDYAHIIVMARPEATLPTQGPVAELLAAHQVETVAVLLQQPAGQLLLQTLTPYPISATAIRQAFREGKRPSQALPEPVLNYIEQHQLYRSE
ncbi:nicotinate-nucleotide adenylyltransferase [Dasania sp. GY-MA-18]|uniref:Probable nicotinate-nucleotide adenylyltransferase n=1 Tax=Dasania phycosphaerae TaxID=2950436 RepID=A0A9J6RH19_9GAMM|nr:MULTISPECIES: nicotinate-nucleotide adenylyltransferase [Dasania]MCR8921214.1 nicotinate-nucleotide adenylyltransferase [Dasania sp. GY-MA-18]MCZ0863642.1 nicotinate-nucleotide adenylyltransferase [Dasania phycosphaerae]MCZ0867370.1 nicotinate-nucleotide adenylyltransferase [Dasania phycosphaerae]